MLTESSINKIYDSSIDSQWKILCKPVNIGYNRVKQFTYFSKIYFEGVFVTKSC